MQFFVEPYTAERTRRFVDLIRARWTELRFSLCAAGRSLLSGCDRGAFLASRLATA